MPTLIETKDLKKHFPIKQQGFFKKTLALKAVDGIDLTIEKGETLGIVGESGCGKSTLGRLLIRLLDPTEGHIRFDGKAIESLGGTALKHQRRAMQMVFQDPYDSLNPRLKIRTILEEPFRIHGLHRGEETEGRIRELLRHVGLSETYLDRYPHEFSGGQRQRIGIARALALNPQFIVADEPVASLDVSIQAQILNLLSKIKGEFKLTLAFIAHDLAVVQYISDRVAVMYLGRIVELAPTASLFEAPRHPYTEALIAAVPLPDPDYPYDRNRMIAGEIPSPLSPPSGCPFHPRCPRAVAVCREERPKLMTVSTGHQVACHLYGGEAVD